MVMVTYALALALNMSGPLAMVVAGLFIGNRGIKYAMSERTRTYVQTFWELIDEILNSVLFLLIGLEVLIVAERVVPFGAAIAAIPIALLARALSVGIPIALVSPGNGSSAVPQRFWSGWSARRHRGRLGALSAGQSIQGRHPEYYLRRGAVFSIVVQGPTVKPLVAKAIRG